MKIFAVTGTIDREGRLILDRPLTLGTPGTVRILVLIPEPTDETESDPDDTSIEEVKASLRRALEQAKARKTIPLSELWERIDTE
jgi:hypothetical protein